jgi:hypothetical protein
LCLKCSCWTLPKILSEVARAFASSFEIQRFLRIQSSGG